MDVPAGGADGLFGFASGAAAGAFAPCAGGVVGFVLGGLPEFPGADAGGFGGFDDPAPLPRPWAESGATDARAIATKITATPVSRTGMMLPPSLPFVFGRHGEHGSRQVIADLIQGARETGR
jgi:hypothetical protein